MRERIERFFLDFEKALKNLKKIAPRAKSDVAIDATIIRFELCYELAWKLIKEYLEDKGIIVKNPRDSFKQAVINDLIEDEARWIMMIEDRNYLVHIYSSEISRSVFEHIKDSYLTGFEYLYRKIKQELNHE